MPDVAKVPVLTVVVLLHGWNGTTEDPWIADVNGMKKRLLEIPGVAVVVPKATQTCVTMMFGETMIKTAANSAWFEVDFRDNPNDTFQFPTDKEWKDHVDAYGLHGRREFSIFQKKWQGLDISMYDIMREARAADRDDIANVVIIGHSMGAFLALYASSLPTTRFSTNWRKEPTETEWASHCKYMHERLRGVVAMHGLYPLTAPDVGGAKVGGLLTSHVGESETMFKFTIGLMLRSVTEMQSPVETNPPHFDAFEDKFPVAKGKEHGPTGPEIDKAVEFVRDLYVRKDG